MQWDLHIKLVICALFAVKAHFGMGQPSISAILLCVGLEQLPSSRPHISASICVCKSFRLAFARESSTRGERKVRAGVKGHPIVEYSHSCCSSGLGGGSAGVAGVRHCGLVVLGRRGRRGGRRALSRARRRHCHCQHPWPRLWVPRDPLPNFSFSTSSFSASSFGTGAGLLLARTCGTLAARRLPDL